MPPPCQSVFADRRNSRRYHLGRDDETRIGFASWLRRPSRVCVGSKPSGGCSTDHSGFMPGGQRTLMRNVMDTSPNRSCAPSLTGRSWAGAMGWPSRIVPLPDPRSRTTYRPLGVRVSWAWRRETDLPASISARSTSGGWLLAGPPRPTRMFCPGSGQVHPSDSSAGPSTGQGYPHRQALGLSPE